MLETSRTTALFYSLRESSPRREQSHANDPNVSDLVLAERAKKRDARAFVALYDRWVDRIYGYVLHKVSDQHIAEDITCQVFLNAWEAIHKFQFRGRPFSAWLFRIAHNLIVDHYRSHRPTSELDSAQAIEEPRHDPEAVLLQRVTVETVRKAVSHLTPDQQQVIILRFFEGMDTPQVARIMGKQEGAVRTMQHRALQSLYKLFERGTIKL